MLTALRSVWIWFSTTVLIIAWTPVLAVHRLLHRDPVGYASGRLFRNLGLALVKANPYWKVEVSGILPEDPRRPYVVVSNHQSSADIPFLSHLPWEMKWMAKSELFKLPFFGWMMKFAGDIRVARKEPRSAVKALRKARWYLEHGCSVMVFPEGTRSPDGKVYPFMDGALRLAVDAGVPILPIAIDGSFGCLPKRTWKFGPIDTIRIKVLPIVETTGVGRAGIKDLTRNVRESILDQIVTWRGVSRQEVDGA